MPRILIISLFTFSIFLTLITTIVLRKGRIPIKYSLVWYFPSFSLFLIAIFPNFISKISTLLGFETISNFVLSIIIALLLFVIMSLTIIVSGLKKKVTLLIQELSLLKSKENKK